MLKRVKYISRFTRPMTAEEIAELGEDSSRKNAELDITGVLMASGGLFFQVLEGPAEHVDELYRTILHDARHSDILLLSSDDPVELREFPDWSMATVNLDAEANVRLMPLKALVKAVFEQRRVLETMVESIERSVRNEMGS